jgi:hypothetical protein
VRQHRRLDRAQPGTGVDAELPRQHPPGSLRGGQRVALTAGAVQRDDQQPPPLLLQRVLGEPVLELGDELGVLAELQPGVHQGGEGSGPHLGQPPALRVGEGSVRPVAVRLPAPEVESRGQGPHRLGGPPVRQQGTAACGEVAEPAGVEVLRARGERVPTALPDDVLPGRSPRALGLQRAAQVHEVGQQRLLRSRGLITVPEGLQETVGVDDARRVRRENGEQQTFLGAGYRHRRPVVPSDLQRSEDRDAHAPDARPKPPRRTGPPAPSAKVRPPS